MGNFVKVENRWDSIIAYKQKVGGVWSDMSENDFRTICQATKLNYGGFVATDHVLSIIGVPSITGETYSFTALYDNRIDVTTACTWTVVSGILYALFTSAGTLSILTNANNSLVTVRAEYDGLTVEKDIRVTYAHGITAETPTHQP